MTTFVSESIQADAPERLFEQAMSIYENHYASAGELNQALELIHQAAVQNHLPSQNALGLHYKEANPKLSVTYFRKAANQGHDEAMVHYAEMLFSGEGTAKNAKEAKMWLQKSAQQGNLEAANILENGTGSAKAKLRTMLTILVIIGIIPWALISVPFVMSLLASWGVHSVKVVGLVVVVLAPAIGLLALIHRE